MGNTESKAVIYATPNNPSQTSTNETIVYRNNDSIGINLFEKYGNKTIAETFTKRFSQLKDKVGFKKRAYNKETKTYTTNIENFTNAEILKKAQGLGSGLISLNLVPEIKEWKDMTLKFAGIYSKNSLEYVIFDIGCMYFGITQVPVYDTLGEEATAFAFNQTKMETCAVTCNHLAGIFRFKKDKNGLNFLKNLLILDSENLSEEFKSQSKEIGLRLFTFEEVIEHGIKNPQILPPLTPDTIYAFSYTSGTTGEPKGAMLSHRNMVSACQGLLTVIYLDEKDVYVSYLPLAHIMERLLLCYCLANGTQICIYSGDILKLKEDLQVFKPTSFVSVPRFYNKIYDSILSGLKDKSSFAQSMFNKGLETKKANFESEATYTHCWYDSLVFSKIKEAFGGRVKAMATGSAPISQEVLEFLKIGFCCPVYEAYGQTEGTGLEFHTSKDDPLGGHVGGPAVTYEFKLVDIPEMKYTSKDTDEQGNPTPRGEIWVRGPSVIPGYYKADDKNAETFTKDGWLQSGDVGMLFSDKRRLKIIDRKKNIFKLSQGEYIAPEKLENFYKLAHLSISGIYVYGDSLKSCIVAILNVEKPALEKFALENGIEEKNVDLLANNDKIKAAYIQLFDKIAKDKKLSSLEKIKAIHIECKTFQELGLLTEAFKVKRVDIREFYKPTLDEIYLKLN